MVVVNFSEFLTKHNALDAYIDIIKNLPTYDTDYPYFLSSKTIINRPGDIINCFTWRRTPQGDRFWLELHRALDKVRVQNFNYDLDEYFLGAKRLHLNINNKVGNKGVARYGKFF